MAGERVLGKPEIDEPGAGNLGPNNQRGRQGECGHHFLGHFARVSSAGFGHEQRQVGCQIAMIRVAGTFDDERHLRGPEQSGDSIQLLPKNVDHSAAFSAFFFGFGFDAASGSAFDVDSGLGVGVGATVTGSLPPSFRGPFPSLP